jgi:hypothetical protein
MVVNFSMPIDAPACPRREEPSLRSVVSALEHLSI